MPLGDASLLFKIRADGGNAEREIAELRAEIQKTEKAAADLNRQKILDGNDEAAKLALQLREARRELEKLEQPVKLQIKAESDALNAEIRDLSAEIKLLQALARRGVELGVDPTALEKALHAAKNEIANLRNYADKPLQLEIETNKIRSQLKQVERDIGRTKAAAESGGNSSGLAAGAVEKLGRARELLGKFDIPGLSKLDSALGTLESGLSGVAGEAGAAGSALGALAGPVGITLAGVTALVAAYAKLTAELFELTAAFAQHAQEVSNASKATGLSVELVSALERPLQSVKADLTDLTDAYAQLAGIAANAAEGNKEATSTLQQLGITAEQALKKPDEAFAAIIRRLAGVKDGAERAALASKVFGEEGGRQFAALADKIQDVDKLIEEARNKGTLITANDIEQAQAFNREVVNLQQRWEGFTNSVARIALPELAAALEKTGRLIDELGNSSGVWGRILTGFLREANIGLNNFLITLRAVKLYLESFGTIPLPAAFGIAQGITERESNARSGTASFAPPSRVPVFAPTPAGGGAAVKSKSSGKSPAEEAAEAELKRARIALQEARRAYDTAIFDAKRTYDLRQSDLEKFVAAQLDAETKLYQERLKIFAAERVAFEKLPAKDRPEKLDELRQRELDEAQRHEQAKTKIQDAANKQREANDQTQRENLLKLYDEFDKRDLARIKTSLDAGLFAREAAERELINLEQGAIDRRIQELERQREQAGQDTALRDNLNSEIQRLAEQRTVIEEGAFKRLNDARVADLESQQNWLDGLARLRQQVAEESLDLARPDGEALRRAGESRLSVLTQQFAYELRVLNAQRAANRQRLDEERNELAQRQGLLSREQAIVAEREKVAARLATLSQEQADIQTKIADLSRQPISAANDAEIDRLDQRRLAVNAELQLETERARALTESYQKLLERKAELDKLYQERALISEEEFQKRKAEIQDRYERERQKQTFGGALNAGLQQLGADVKTFQDAVVAAAGLATEALSGLAQGVGNLVQNWVLLGTTGPGAMKKLVASVLAGVAAQSAILAVFELAKGFASLFFNPAEAAAHFQAAALFGAIAVGTGLAGRAIAGNSFQQQGAASGGGGGNTNTNGGTVGGDGRTVERDRFSRQPPPQTINLVLNVRSNDSHIVNVAAGNIRNNGLLRDVILTHAPA